jgi:transposase-like protein
MRARVLGVGDGALGFWGALREVFPEAREKRCWFHYADLRIMPTWSVDPTKAAGLAMAFKLIEAAQARWRAVNAPHLVALVRNGATFQKGKLVERTTTRRLTEAA